MRPLIMGILNVTPDSFSDGGKYFTLDLAVEHGNLIFEQGADIVDVGGESTRPGSEPTDTATQIQRVVPVISALVENMPEKREISVDTTSSVVARAALGAGALIVNDVSAGTMDSQMFPIVADHGVKVILMHMQGTPKTMQDSPYYRNVIEEVRTFLLRRADAAIAAGVSSEAIMLDPGIGFGKRTEDNLRLISGLHRLVDTGYPIVLGTSRKRFMGSICRETEPRRLIGATVATTAIGVLKGARVFRVHDVAANRQAADVAAAIVDAGNLDQVGER